MALTKKQRQKVWAKSQGHCWYCGCTLPEKGWHADHVDPVFRDSELVRDEKGQSKIIPTGTCWKPENDKLENMVPSCAPCNLFKSTFSVEQFRGEISEQINRARRSSVNFRTAERFGQITIKSEPVIFWFEKQQLTATSATE